MCGRFTLRVPAAEWTQEFLPLWTEDQVREFSSQQALAARYNIAPTDACSCVYAGKSSDQPRRWSMFRWGLVPSWADDLNVGARMINARSETADSKPAFREAFRKRRCIVPADGYYEWEKSAGGKQPFLIERATERVLGMAGLWEPNFRFSSEDDPLLSFTVLTTAANQTTKSIHDRMPVFLDREAQAIWLDHETDDVGQLRDLLQPAPEDLLRTTPVSSFVNSVRNDSPECVRPVNPLKQPTLFD